MSDSIKAYTADRIFTGEHWLQQHAVITADKKIKELVPLQSLPSSLHVEQFHDAIIAPALIDLQIYGAYGKLLAVDPGTDALTKLNAYCNQGGAAYCMPTVATNTIEVFHQCIDAVRAYWKQGGEGVLGLHLEGPWLNPVKRGAHIESLIHPPVMEEVESLLNYGKGVIRMITLAPESCDPAIIGRILADDIIIAAGHSNATYAEAKNGFANGITAVTHLYNAMRGLQHRSPGLVGAAMDDAAVMASIIPDGHHVDYAAIRIAKKVMQERLFVITDAVTETTEGMYPHQLEGDKYVAGNILSGSALTMVKAVQNLVQHAGVDLAEALRMCSLYPARVIRADQSLGKILPGYSADMLLLTQKLACAGLLRG